jgi:hypothetical protein
MIRANERIGGQAGERTIMRGGEVMTTRGRRAMIVAVLGLLGGVTALGCQDGAGKRHAWLRGTDPAAQDARTAELIGAIEDKDEANPDSAEMAKELSRETRGFFQPTRRAGSLSPEAAEIERSLGVPR